MYIYIYIIYCIFNMDLGPVNTEYSDPGHIEIICDMFFRECVAQAREVKAEKMLPIAIAGMKTIAPWT